MDHGEQCRYLAAEVEAALAETDVATDYSLALREALSGQGGILSESPRARWASFVINSCQSASHGTCIHALPAGAAVEILAAALELFDDIEDYDSREFRTRRERSVGTNLAYGLVAVSHLCLQRLSHHKNAAEKFPRISRLLLQAAARMGGGQHLDLLHEGRGDVSPDECLKIASLKSAELVKCAVEIGAVLGTDGERQIELYGQFGWNLGMFAQIINDIEGVSRVKTAKSDVSWLRATLPVVFWLRGEGTGSREGIERLPLSKAEERRIRDEIRGSGALHYAWVIADLYRERAKEILSELDKFGPASSFLSYLVERVEPESVIN